MSNFKSSVQRGACLVVIIAMLSGCAVGPDFVRPAPPETDRYTREPRPEATVAADGQAQHFTPGASITADWWRLFKSAQLDAIVQKAIANNPTLQASEASLRQSQDNMRAGYGVFFPQIQAGLDVSRQQTAPLLQGSETPGTIFNLVTLSGTISYALDVFGGARRTVESLRAQVDYQRYETEAAYLMLSANVVNTSIARAAYAAQIRATEQLIELENQQLHLAEAQVRAGIAPYANVLSIRSLIATNRALLAPLEQKVSQSEHLLATLEGVLPSKATLPDIDLTGFSLPVDLPVSLPSDLVRQRPDIMASEALLHAASAQVGVATANLYPQITLTGSYGSEANTIGSMFSSSTMIWSLGAGLLQPIFRGGTLTAKRRAAIAAYDQAVAQYRETVLLAFQNVADVLRALEADARTLRAQADAEAAAHDTLELTQKQFQLGAVSYLSLLNAERQYQQVRISLVQAQALRFADTAALFQALGGGWWNQRPREDAAAKTNKE